LLHASGVEGNRARADGAKSRSGSIVVPADDAVRIGSAGRACNRFGNVEVGGSERRDGEENGGSGTHDELADYRWMKLGWERTAVVLRKRVKCCGSDVRCGRRR